ncbi:InlB B-repeat-containing protein [Butyrivibrio sp. NC2002]|uniref:InlB B-repeat-containing protein n=1 Tax=Butyrivibrio sp. NC2002 TaxID=1410610 RepID=UPI00056867F7|nr:InlB B-repeat-containing protein [Butyrivibrio sp. NC2002]
MKKLTKGRLLSGALATALTVANMGALMPMTALAAGSVIDITYYNSGVGSLSADGKTFENSKIYDSTGTQITAATDMVASNTNKNVVVDEDKDVEDAYSLTAYGNSSGKVFEDGANAPSGYTFAGWSNGTAGKVYTKSADVDYEDAHEFTELPQTTDMNLYPVWRAEKNDVTYNLNIQNGEAVDIDASHTIATGAGLVKSYTSGDKLTTLTLADFNAKTSDAYYFDGWTIGTINDDPSTATVETAYKIAEGGSTNFAMAGNITVKANYKAYWILTPDVTTNGTGAILKNKWSAGPFYAAKDGTITLPGTDDVYLSGKKLAGWSKKPNDVEADWVAPGSKVTLSANTPYYAQYEDNTTNLTITLTGAKVAGAAFVETSDEFSFDSTATGSASAVATAVITSLKVGETLDLSKIRYTETGKAIIGWSTNASTMVKSYAKDAKVTLSESILTVSGSNYTLALYPVTEEGHNVVYNGVTDTTTLSTNPSYVTKYADYIATYSESTSHVALDYPKELIPAENTFVGYATLDADVASPSTSLDISNGKSTGSGKFLNVGDSFTVGNAPYNADITLYPVLLPIKAISYNPKGGDGEIDATEYVYGDKEVTLASEGFTKKGYALKGWDTTNTGTTVVYELGETLDANDTNGLNNATLTLYAVWGNPETYKITFVANGGSGTMDVQEITQQAGDKLNANAFTAPAGKKFAGWATSASGDVVYTDEATTENIKEATTLFAVWVDDGSAEAAKADAIAAAVKAADAAVANPTEASIKAADDAIAAAKAAGATDAELKAATDKLATAKTAYANRGLQPNESGKSDDGASVKATSDGKGVVVTSTDNKNKVKIGDTVKVNGVEYPVVELAKKAITGKKVKNVTINAKNLTKVNKNAFKGAKNLKKVTIKGVKKTSKVAKAIVKAAKKVNKNVKIVYKK